MTYPPQQGPSPGQPPHGYPYNQQYGGYFYPGGAGGPQPPKDSKLGLWISVAVGILAVSAFLVTGLIAPGFLLGDDDNKRVRLAGPPSSGPADPRPEHTTDQASPPRSSGAAVPHFDSVDELFGKFVAALNSGDAAAATSMLCPEVLDLTRETTTKIARADSDLRIGEVESRGEVQLVGIVDGEGAGVSLTAYKIADSFCMRYVIGPTAMPLQTAVN